MRENLGFSISKICSGTKNTESDISGLLNIPYLKISQVFELDDMFGFVKISVIRI